MVLSYSYILSMVRTLFLWERAVKKGGNAPRAMNMSTEIKILCKLPLLYDSEKKYHTDVNSLKMILVSQNNPTRQEMVPTELEGF